MLVILFSHQLMTEHLLNKVTSVEFTNITEHHGILEKLERPRDYISNKENLKENHFKIPNIAHFIWIGAVIADKYIANIKLFSSVNPHFKVTKVKQINSHRFFCRFFSGLTMTK